MLPNSRFNRSIYIIFFIKKSALETNKTGNLEHVPTFKTEGLSIEPSQRTATKKRIFIGLIYESSNDIKLGLNTQYPTNLNA